MLKSLELFGFKSFADRTRFDFAPGITGVVGPNGSGKSNVVDAIKWILGDQSPKSLRGQEMTDVIFNGASGRKGAGFAEATLTFDNASGFLPIEGLEVQVGRRLWRNGDAEYLINNAPARLRDVRELLMGTGAGSAAYSIIEQGRVDQILQANAAARRQVFEEAAGISLFKSRRIDAERRLARVEQNLLRLTDIVDELEARLNATRSQAAKAAKYRELSNELRAIWLGLAADECRFADDELDAAERGLAELSAEHDALAAQQTALHGRLNALDEDGGAIDERLREIERQAAGVREAAARFESTIRHETEALRELDGEIARLRRQRTESAVRLGEVAGEIDRHAIALEQAERDFDRRQAEVADQTAEITRETTSLDEAKRTVAERREMRQRRAHEAAQGAQRIHRIEADLARAEGRAREAEQRLARLNEKLAELDEDRTEREALVREAAAFLSAAEERIRGFRAERGRLAGEQDQFQRTLAEQREERSALAARKAVLEDLEHREEGLSIGVREILQRARMSPHAPWNHVLGSVADLLEVDLDHAGLLEVALGPRAQHVVVDELSPLIEYLTQADCVISGRVSFVPCSVRAVASRPPGSAGEWGRCEETDAHNGRDETPSPIDNTIRAISACSPSEGGQESRVDLSGLPGVRVRLDALVRSAPHVPQLAEQLLGDTWVVETVGAAVALASGAGRGCRFVTLQGELIDADGTLTAGSVRGELAVVSRKSELRRVRNELVRIEYRIAEEESRIARLIESLSGVDAELTEATRAMQGLSDRHSLLKADVAEVDREIERVRTDRTLVESDRESSRQQIETGRSELALAAADAERLAAELDAVRTSMAEADEGVSQAEQRIAQLAARRAAAELELARQEERVHSMRHSQNRLEEDHRQRGAQNEESIRRLDLARRKQSQVLLHLLNGRSELNELSVDRERWGAAIAAVLEEKQSLRALRSSLQQEETGLRQRLHAIEDQRHRTDLRRREIETQIATLAGRIEEEYQLTLEQVVESGASAYGAYLEERTRSEWGDRVSGLGDRDPGTGDQDSGDDESSSDAQPFTVVPPLSTLDPTFAEVRPILDERVNRLRRKLKHMGSVNTDSLRDLDELESRHQDLHAQLQDLVEARTTLEDIIRRINHESKRMFLETFQQVRENFQRLFRRAFGGGDGDVILENPDEVLDCGIDIVARPPGKELKSILLMSGGEKTLTAFALLLAIFQCRPSPYCVLDEVDAALDEANVERLTSLLREFERATQFLIVTHKKPTMTICDAIYGVTMEEAGVSKRISVRFEDLRDDGGVAATTRTAA